jgi:hypothetical protein
MHLILDRRTTSDQGTFGKMIGEGFSMYTGELPWRENQQGISCIPGDVSYDGKIVCSHKFGEVYMVLNVPERSAILIHSGNLCGDRTKGFGSHVLGCILLGNMLGIINGQQRAVLDSKAAVRRFMIATEGQPIILEVRNNGLW